MYRGYIGINGEEIETTYYGLYGAYESPWDLLGPWTLDPLGFPYTQTPIVDTQRLAIGRGPKCHAVTIRVY